MDLDALPNEKGEDERGFWERHTGPSMPFRVLSLSSLFWPPKLLRLLKHIHEDQCDNYCLGVLLFATLPYYIARVFYAAAGYVAYKGDWKLAGIVFACAVGLHVAGTLKGQFYTLLAAGDRLFKLNQRLINGRRSAMKGGGLQDMLRDLFEGAGFGVDGIVEMKIEGIGKQEEEDPVQRLINESNKLYRQKKAKGDDPVS